MRDVARLRIAIAESDGEIPLDRFKGQRAQCHLVAVPVQRQFRGDAAETSRDRRRIGRAERGQHHQAGGVGPARHMRKPVERGSVAPMDVFELEQQRRVRRHCLDSLGQLPQHALARGVAARFHRAALRPRPKRRHLCEPAWRVCREDDLDGAVIGRAGKPGQSLDQRQIGLAHAMMIETLALRDPHAVPIERVRKGAGERTFADAGFAGHEHHLAPARQRSVEATLKLLHLRRPPDELRWIGRSAGKCSRRLTDFCHLRDRHHQPIAAPVQGLDVLRPAGIVAERAPQLLDAGGQRIVADCKTAPDPVEQFLLGDERLTSLDEHGQHGGSAGCQLPLRRSRQSSPVRASNRNGPNVNCLSSAIRGLLSQAFPEFSRNSPSTFRALAAKFVAYSQSDRNHGGTCGADRPATGNVSWWLKRQSPKRA